jgi:Ca2+-binding EF-hand superfamily protein
MSRNRMLVATLAMAGVSIFAATGAVTAAESASFESLDKNSDGKIGMDEASANDKLFVAFKKLDTDKDGALSKAEFAAYKPA